MRNIAGIMAGALVLVLSGCSGVRAVEGHYAGQVSGTMYFIGIPAPVDGNIDFTLEPAGADQYAATGMLVVTRKSDGAVTYEATLGGGYANGDLNLTFTATDGKSSGTMTGRLGVGKCWKDTSWTISGTGTTGSGSWSACRQ